MKNNYTLNTSEVFAKLLIDNYIKQIKMKFTFIFPIKMIKRTIVQNCELLYIE